MTSVYLCLFVLIYSYSAFLIVKRFTAEGADNEINGVLAALAGVPVMLASLC